jgi:hypothetical protein
MNIHTNKNKIVINYIMNLKNKINSVVGKMRKPLSKVFSKFTRTNDLLHNKILLYAVFIFSLLNLFLFANTGNYTHVAIFMLIGFITSFFSKNMMVILLLSLILTNILKYGSSLSEGFEEGADGDQDNEGNTKKKKKGLNEDKEGLDEGIDEDKEGLDEGIDEDKEGLDEDKDKEGLDEDKEKENLQDLKSSAKELLSNISKLNSTIQNFSNFDFTK